MKKSNNHQQSSAAPGTTSGVRTHLGSCHCGAARFTVAWDEGSGATRCNCTLCTKTAITGAVVKPDAFSMLSGETSLASYEWGGKTGRRFFCRVCGIHCFGRGYLAELGGDYVSVNVNTLDDLEMGDVQVLHWDGRHDNWQSGLRPTPWPVFADEALAAAR